MPAQCNTFCLFDFTKKIVSITIGFIILFISLFVNIKYLTPIALNYTNYGTYFNKKQSLAKEWNILYDKENLSNDYSKNKYILLDFWSRSCGTCYTKLPFLENLYKSYNNKNKIEIISVLVQYDLSDSTFVKNKIKPKNYSFPIAFGDSTTCKTFNIISFPTVVIIHNGEMIYKGTIKKAIEYLPIETINQGIFQ